jgi:hypothetical protein
VSGAEIIKVLIILQQLLDRFLQAQIERSQAEDKQALSDAIMEARRARTSEEKAKAAGKIARAFAGRRSDPPPGGGIL